MVLLPNKVIFTYPFLAGDRNRFHVVGAGSSNVATDMSFWPDKLDLRAIYIKLITTLQIYYIY